MNIFYLHSEPEVAAKMHCDKHCVKMILETAQLLSTAHREMTNNEYADKTGLYKATHKNHPSAVWVRKSRDNYQWAYSLLVALCEEYTLRYGKIHKTQQSGIVKALKNAPRFMPFKSIFTEPPQCMPEEYKCEHPVDAYRKYYLGEKMRFAVWNHGNTPEWVLKAA